MVIVFFYVINYDIKFVCDFFCYKFLFLVKMLEVNGINWIYISCFRVIYRKIINEDEVIGVLEEFGFVIIVIELIFIKE